MPNLAVGLLFYSLLTLLLINSLPCNQQLKPPSSLKNTVLYMCKPKLPFLRILPLLVFLHCALPGKTLAQVPPGFVRNQSLPVYHNGLTLHFAWAGGLHNPQFSAIDLNNDGLQDLFVFDKINKHLLTFINNGTPNEPDYTFAPEYVQWFPPLHDWALLTDFNADELPDIFTYGIAGISAYQTTRLPDNSLQFTLVEEQLRFNSFSGPLNILANSSDIPAFTDVNNDGDVDVLTFDFVGKYVEYYENQSQELTGTPSDTLWFEQLSECWGKFSESGATNAVLLNDDCDGWFSAPAPPDFSRQMHSGSTLLALDLNNDGAKELIVGDVSYPNLIMLTNGGTPDDALMTDFDLNFPAYDVPVNLPVFPAAFYTDVNNDAKPDLLVAVNDRNNGSSLNSVWYYQNTGTAETPLFTLQTNNFMLQNMVDVGLRSYPVWIDCNNDGLTDILTGSYGVYNFATAGYQARLTLLQNTGTAYHPQFELVTADFDSLSQYNFRGLFPAFGDLDNDGDPDMLAGDELGFLHYFENTAPLGSPINLTLTQPNFMEVTGADAVTPCLYDVDADGALDLICGERAGKLNYYRNTTTETGTLSFTLVSNFWGAVDVRELGTPYGYSAPVIAPLDSTGQPFLLVNSDNGHIHLYTNLDQPVFTELDSFLSGINDGGRGGISLTDINTNNGMDLLVGNARGGIALFSQPGDTIEVGILPPAQATGTQTALRIYPMPAENHNFTLQLPGNPNQPRQLSIFNLQGQPVNPITQIYTGNSQTIQVQLPPQTPPGLYLLALTTPQKVYTAKVVLK
ncbi:hypothetical protein C7N43_26135 [Sphingobacteriales bacterium UPWRP_1]|nr:hypothetical protein C7N43_26135 [Sphingobacteriales bacterium UPWRP_1]